MTDGQLVVIAVRVLVPLLILRRPLVGGVLAMAMDGLDVVVVEFFGSGGMGEHYHQIDKGLDLWYLGLEAWIAAHWAAAVPRDIALGLFAYRVVGVALFELIDSRWLLFVFPNQFESWFLFVLIAQRRFPGLHDTITRLRGALTWLLVLLVPKMGQEYLLHIAEAQPWGWLKSVIGI